MTVAACALVALGLTTSPASAESSEQQFVALVNELRTSQGLPPYETHPELEAKARAWAQVMADKGEIWHSQLSDGIESSWGRLAENVGMGPTVDSLHGAFVDSPAHHRNLVNDQLELVGIGVVEANGTLFVAQEFMTLAPPPPPVRSAPPAPQPQEAPADQAPPRPAPAAVSTPVPAPAPLAPTPAPAPALAPVAAALPVATAVVPLMPVTLGSSDPARELAGRTISASTPISGGPVGLAVGLLAVCIGGLPAFGRLARRPAHSQLAALPRELPQHRIGDGELYDIVSRAT